METIAGEVVRSFNLQQSFAEYICKVLIDEQYNSDA
jgi:hypothetical protein